MIDIVQRLNAHASCGGGCCSDTRRLMNEASDEIVRLRALITEWAEADRGEAEGSYDRFRDAVRALREEAIRQIT